ncbi:hypothetical protein GCM10010495_76970 [Kitasatospora herbaricolor]|nr:hypothetical protein GCM10010495_76970 [Kitasatospora herbaricolor]
MPRGAAAIRPPAAPRHGARPLTGTAGSGPDPPAPARPEVLPAPHGAPTVRPLRRARGTPVVQSQQVAESEMRMPVMVPIAPMLLLGVRQS